MGAVTPANDGNTSAAVGTGTSSNDGNNTVTAVPSGASTDNNGEKPADTTSGVIDENGSITTPNVTADVSDKTTTTDENAGAVDITGKAFPKDASKEEAAPKAELVETELTDSASGVLVKGNLPKGAALDVKKVEAAEAVELVKEYADTANIQV